MSAVILTNDVRRTDPVVYLVFVIIIVTGGRIKMCSV